MRRTTEGMSRGEREAYYHKYASLLGIHRNELIAVYPSGPSSVKALVPNNDVVSALRESFPTNFKLLYSGPYSLVEVDFSEDSK